MANRIRQVLPTGQAPSASISPGAFDAEFAAAGNLGAQISQFGGALGDQGVRIGMMQEQEEFSNASVDYDTDLTVRRIELDQDPDLASHGKKITDWHDKWWSERMKGVMNNNARDRLDLFSKSAKNVSLRRVTFEAARKLESRTRGMLGFKADSYAQKEVTAPTPKLQREVRKEWNDYLKSLIGSGTITADEAAMFNARYGDFMQKQREDILEEMKIEDFVAAREQAMGFETVEEATSWIDGLTGQFDRTERNDLIAQVKRKFGYRTAEATQALENKRKADRQGIVNKFLAKDFTNIEIEINRTDLEPLEKMDWIEKAEIRAKAIAAGKKDPFEVTDPETYFKIRRRIANDPESVTEAELAALVGKTKKEVDKKAKPVWPIEFQGDKSLFEYGIQDFSTPLAAREVVIKDANGNFFAIKQTDFYKLEKMSDADAKKAFEGPMSEKADSSILAGTGGISIKDYEKLLGMITVDPEKPDNPQNRPSARRGFAVVDRLRAQKITEAKKEPREFREKDKARTIEDRYFDINAELEDWITKNAELVDFDKKLGEQVQILTRPPKEEIVLNFFEKLITPRTKEPEKLIEKKLAKIKKLPVWGKLSDEEKKGVEAAFERGVTIEDIIRAVE